MQEPGRLLQLRRLLSKSSKSRQEEAAERGDTFSCPIISHFLFIMDPVLAHIHPAESQDVPFES